MRKLFGTDGVRGVAGVDLTPDLGRSLGAAAVVAAGGASVVIGRDTRESGPELEQALVEGIESAGGEAVLAGVIPTPGVAMLTAAGEGTMGCVISASHNPYADNGIKFLGRDGRKLSDAAEASIERAINGPLPDTPGSRRALRDPVGRYVEWLAETFGGELPSGITVGLDCANGAAHAAGPALMRRVGMPFHAIGDAPDGRNINAGCGSMHLEAVAGLVRDHGLDLGIAFDGDADRCLAVDAAGRVANGDVILAVLAIDLARRGLLRGNQVVVTTMTNLGFQKLMREQGIEVEVTDVGDRYVLERMLETGASLGGEQSGHVVMLDRHTTGDGLATALALLGALNRLDLTLADAVDLVVPFPQRLVAVPADRALLPSADRIWQEVDAVTANLGERGRVVLRASGTEPVVRVMVEAQDAGECERICNDLARLVREQIGTPQATE